MPKLLLISSDPLSAMREKGNIKMVNFHNPNEFFSKVYDLRPPSKDSGVEKPFTKFITYNTRVLEPKSRISRGLGIIKTLMKAIKIVRRNNVNIIRSQSPYFPALVGILVHKLTGIPCIVSLHDDYDFSLEVENRNFLVRALGEFMERFTISSATKVFVLTPYLKQYAINHGAKPENIVIIPHGVDLKVFRKEERVIKKTREELGMKEDDLLLSFVGRLENQKDPLTLLQAYQIVKNTNPKFKLIIVGDGSLRDEMEKLTEERKIKDVMFTGFIPQKNVAAIMSAADAFILPTLHEGFGFVFIEAQASGLPVVTTDIPHTRGIVTKENALLFEPRNAEAAAKQILMLQNREIREKLSIKSLENAKRFSLDRYKNKCAKAFSEILGGSQNSKNGGKK